MVEGCGYVHNKMHVEDHWYMYEVCMYDVHLLFMPT